MFVLKSNANNYLAEINKDGSVWQYSLPFARRFQTESELLIYLLCADGRSVMITGPVRVVEIKAVPARFRYRLPDGVDNIEMNVRSESVVGQNYYVTVDSKGNGMCSCKDWKFRHSEDGSPCKHMKKALGYLATIRGDEWVEV